MSEPTDAPFPDADFIPRDMSFEPAADGGAGASRPLSPAYQAYAMTFLFVAYVFNFVDRQIVTILAESMKADLALADWQIGVVTGLAFALFYTLMGLPLARLADRHSRTLIITVSLAAWSMFTVLCAFARNFTDLVLLRIGVGVGEAGCSPAAHSLITDYAPREKRAMALSIYAMGNPVGMLVGMGLGGLVAQEWGWRVAFMAAGFPGLVLALLALLTLRETRIRGKARSGAAPDGGFADTMRRLLPKRSYWLLAFGIAGSVFVLAPFQGFAAPFFLRNHAEGVGQLATAATAQFGVRLEPIGFLGLALGAGAGLGGGLGMLVGGVLADRLGRYDERGYVVGPALALFAATPVCLAACTVPDAGAALILWGLAACLLMLPTGPVFAAVQTIAPPGARAMAAAILLFTLNIIGTGLGPLTAGFLSDLLNAAGGLGPAEGVRQALMWTSLAAPLAGALVWMSRRSIRQDCGAQT